MEENNKLIAEFMGMENERHSDGRYLFTTDIDELKGADTRFWEQLYFHVSWDWLMPVVSKITRDKEYRGNHCREHLMDIVPYGHIEDTYDAVVDFIREYRLTPKEVV